jgi:hypothetical protein
MAIAQRTDSLSADARKNLAIPANDALRFIFLT